MDSRCGNNGSEICLPPVTAMWSPWSQQQRRSSSQQAGGCSGGIYGLSSASVARCSPSQHFRHALALLSSYLVMIRRLPAASDWTATEAESDAGAVEICCSTKRRENGCGGNRNWRSWDLRIRQSRVLCADLLDGQCQPDWRGKGLYFLSALFKIRASIKSVS